MVKYRQGIRILALVVFITLLFIGKVQTWIIVFLKSLLLSKALRRFYFGYQCSYGILLSIFLERIKNV